MYKIPIIKILVGVFARARAMEKYEERSPRTFYQALEDGTCRGFYIRFLCSDCEKLNRIRTLFFYRNWYLIYFRVLMTKLYTSCPIENFEKLRKGEASNRPLCLRMLKEKERGRQKSPDLVRILLLYVQLPTDVFKVHSPTEPKSNACQRRQCYSYICSKFILRWILKYFRFRLENKRDVELGSLVQWRPTRGIWELPCGPWNPVDISARNLNWLILL